MGWHTQCLFTVLLWPALTFNALIETSLCSSHFCQAHLAQPLFLEGLGWAVNASVQSDHQS